jgi:uroporphyrinogen-III decarboxylase
MIIAVMLGAKFSFFADKDSDVTGYPLKDIKDAFELPPVDKLLNHQFIKDLTKEVVKIQKSRPDLTVIPPFFWDLSGRATIHGIITTSLKLVGENIITLLLVNPQLAHSINQWIADVYIAIIKYFSKLANLPVTSVHIGECSGTMLSRELYEEFIVPYISTLGDKLGKIRLHSCGKSDYLIESFAKIRNLGVIDTGSGTSVKKIREILGNNIEINVFPAVEILMKGSSKEKVKEWLYRILEENNNGPLKIAYHLENEYDINNCLFIHEELYRLGLITQSRNY